MKSSSRLVLVATHLAALVLGLVLFRAFTPAASNSPGNSASATPAATGISASETPTPSPSSRAKPRTKEPSKNSVHLAAWKSLASQGLTRPERMKASALLLQGWIQEDWQTALDVVMKETPDDFALLDEFHEVFTREPEAVWQIIEQKRYGVLSHTLLGRWQSALANRDEAFVRSFAETLPERGKAAALETLQRAKPGQPYSGGG